ncbi:MAG TPA: hypothetical protein VMS65_14625 [Polyangiaceae bacterium]|nr:hypothetical protein [Polyangiaceae bacterium]
MNARVRQSVTLVFGVMAWLLAPAWARAEGTSVRPWVVVLRPGSGPFAPWPEGMQAVVAELVAGGYELTLRASVAENRDDLLAELERVVEEERVLGAVVVVRDGNRGIAYVCTRNGTVRVEAGLAEGAVGEGALALRITQLLGPPRFELEKPRPTPAPAPAPSAPSPPPRRDHGLLLALQAGLAFSSDLTEPLPLAGFVARKDVVGPLSLDGSAWLTLGASRLEASAGTVDIDAEELALHLSLNPFRENSLGLSLGLGGGIVWVQGKGEAAANYTATDDSTRVALLSARATASFRHNQFSLLVAIEPGVMLPPVSIGAGDDVSRLGRPWTQASVGLGWNL